MPSAARTMEGFKTGFVRDSLDRRPSLLAITVIGFAALGFAALGFARPAWASVAQVSEPFPEPVRSPLKIERVAPPTMTLALKFVEFTDADHGGKPVLTRWQAERVVAGINDVYAQCGLKLALEDYEQVDPSRFGLSQKLSSPDEMDSVRTPFDSSRYLVVIHTGAWDHAPRGPMGKANAWTAMPGQLPAGAVLEAPVASNGNITAHELGHYLGLDHARDGAELMNPIIYQDSVRITPAQCRQMRQTALSSRAGAIRPTT